MVRIRNRKDRILVQRRNFPQEILKLKYLNSFFFALGLHCTRVPDYQVKLPFKFPCCERTAGCWDADACCCWLLAGETADGASLFKTNFWLNGRFEIWVWNSRRGFNTSIHSTFNTDRRYHPVHPFPASTLTLYDALWVPNLVWNQISPFPSTAPHLVAFQHHHAVPVPLLQYLQSLKILAL